MLVIKADGKKERFQKRKIIRSLEKIGIKKQQAQEITQKIAQSVQKQFKKTIQSNEIFERIVEILKRKDTVYASRYNLRRAVMNLGPSGYPFEQYVARILEDFGYRTKTNQILKGYCVSHEVDVVAYKDNNRYMIECKYHNTRGARSDVKVALYSWARFQDIKRNWEQSSGSQRELYNVWLITNTRFTQEAIDYGNCMGIKITGWGYPPDASLEIMIEQTKTYPINIFPHIGSTFTFQRFYEAGIFLAKNILAYPLKELRQKTHLPEQELIMFQKEAEKLCC